MVFRRSSALTKFVLVALWVGLPDIALAQDGPSENTRASDVTISFKSDWSRENQQETSAASATTTTGGKQTLTISKSVFPDMVLGLDLTHATLNQMADGLTPGLSEHGSLNKESGEANAFVEIKRFGLTFKPSVRLGLDNYRLNRPDTLFTGLMARSQSSGWHAGADFEISTIVPLSESVFIRPIADLDYSTLTVDPFAESGAGFGDAAFDSVYDQRVTLQMGLGAATRLPLGQNAWLTPYVQARYRHNFNTDPISTQAALIANPSFSKSAVLAVAEPADGLIVDAGMFLAANGNWEVMANYEGKFFPYLTGQTFSGRLKFDF